MTILINLLKSIVVIGLNILIFLAAAVIRGFPVKKKEDGIRKLIILSITLGIISGIICSIWIVWLHK